MKWIALCNGGPNDTTVGREYDSLGKACGALENMMKSLGASLGYIQKVEGQQKLDDGCFVSKEEEEEEEEEEDDE